MRQEVFVKEQGVAAELEFDGQDKEATHYLAQLAGEVVGTCRLVITDQVAKIERMAIKADWRKQGVGTALLDRVAVEANKEDLSQLVLHSQLRAKDFYLDYGFEVLSQQTFKEAGIEHLKMSFDL